MYCTHLVPPMRPKVAPTYVLSSLLPLTNDTSWRILTLSFMTRSDNRCLLTTAAVRLDFSALHWSRVFYLIWEEVPLLKIVMAAQPFVTATFSRAGIYDAGKFETRQNASAFRDLIYCYEWLSLMYFLVICRSLLHALLCQIHIVCPSLNIRANILESHRKI